MLTLVCSCVSLCVCCMRTCSSDGVLLCTTVVGWLAHLHGSGSCEGGFEVAVQSLMQPPVSCTAAATAWSVLVHASLWG